MKQERKQVTAVVLPPRRQSLQRNSTVILPPRLFTTKPKSNAAGGEKSSANATNSRKVSNTLVPSVTNSNNLAVYKSSFASRSTPSLLDSSSVVIQPITTAATFSILSSDSTSGTRGSAAAATAAGIMGTLRRRPTVVGAKVPKKRVSSRVVVEIPANPERSPMSHTATFPLSPGSNEYILDKYSPASAGADVNYFGIGAGMNKLWTSVFGAKDESSSTATTSGIAATGAAASIEVVPGHTMLAVQVKQLSGGGRLKKSQSSHELGASVDKVISPPTPASTPVPTTPSAVTTELAGEASVGDPGPVTVESPPIKAPVPVPEKEIERDRYGFKKETRFISLDLMHAFETQYNPILYRREQKWKQLLASFPEGQFPPRSAQMKRFIRKGVPPYLRGQCWLHYSGAGAVMKQHPDRYQRLLSVADHPKYASTLELIERDLHRTFPENIQFKASSSSSNMVTEETERKVIADSVPMLRKLRRVLTAFAIRNPSIGYCQSLNFIAGMFLLFMDEQEAFWMLCTVVERIMPEGTYSVTMEGATADQEVLMGLIQDRLFNIWQVLAGAEEVPPLSLITSHWFLTLYTDVTPVETALRIWDCLFYEGCTVLFRVALTLIKMHESQLLKVPEPLVLFQTLQLIPKKMLNCHTLMESCFKTFHHLTRLSEHEVIHQRKEARELHQQLKAHH